MFVKNKLVMFLATGCFVGYIPFAPGTFGTIVGLPIIWGLSKTPLMVAMALCMVMFVISIWIAHLGEKLSDRKDPGFIVIDEILGYAIALLGMPFHFFHAIAGFIIFRVFDILKPFPIGLFDRKLTGGFGIMMDDVIAGIMTNLLLRSICYSSGIS